MGCLLWKIYFASVFLSIKKGSNFVPPIILYKLVDEEIGRILKISIMFCVGNCLINLCLNRIAIFLHRQVVGIQRIRSWAYKIRLDEKKDSYQTKRY